MFAIISKIYTNICKFFHNMALKSLFFYSFRFKVLIEGIFDENAVLELHPILSVFFFFASMRGFVKSLQVL